MHRIHYCPPTSKAHEETEEHWIEESEANCKNILMDQRRQRKHKKHSGWSETLLRYLEGQKQEEYIISVQYI